MKRILIFSLNYYPHFIGGAEVAIKEITDRLSPTEFEFHMITLRIDSTLPEIERVGNVIVHRIGFTTKNPSIADLRKFPLHLNKYYFQIGAYWKAAELHQKRKFDAVWAMMAHSCAIPGGLFKKKFPNVSYLLTLQEGDPPEHIERMMLPVWWLFKRGFTSADVLQPISTFLQQWGIRMGFRGSADVIPNAVDVARFSHAYTPEELSMMKEKLGKKDDDVFVVTTSRLVHKNGVDDVIRALPLLPQNVSFLIYGIGPDEAMLRALAKELGVESRARFMGQISQDEMPLMLQACDIFTRPSRSEGMGISFIEAMAARLPVIATQEGGIADFLFDDARPSALSAGKPMTGWAVDVNAPEQIAKAVRDILAQPEKVSNVVTNAAEMVREKYDWNSITEDMRKLFENLASQGAKPRDLKRGLKIALATPLYPPESGGPATYAKLLVEHLPVAEVADVQNEVVLVKFSEVRGLPKVIRHIAYYFKVLNAARDADVVFALDPVSTGLPALLAARTLGKPFVVKIVGDFAWEQGRQRFGVTATLDEFVQQEKVGMSVGLLRAVQTFVAKGAVRILVPSNYLKRIVISSVWGNISPEKVSVIYNSVMLPELSPVSSIHATNTSLVVSVGRLVPWKGMSALIEAIAEIRKKNPSNDSVVALQIVGDGPDRQLLEEQGSNLLGGAVSFTGALTHTETMQAMNAATVYVQNSSYEGLSHQLIEALMLGKAIVATSVGGNPELIQHEVNGLLVPWGDTTALVEAIERLLSDVELRARLGAHAKESATRFRVPVMIEQTRKVLESVRRK